MAEFAASILQPVVDHAVKGVSAVVKRQFNYLCCFTTNVNGLEVEAKTLDDATQGVQGEVDRARENAQDIVPAVEAWLADSNNFKGKVNGLLLNEVPNVKTGCFKLSARYSLSKKAMKTAEDMKEHRQKWTEIASNGISHPKPPAAAVQIPSVGGTAYEFESRKQIEEEIMTSLKGKNEDMIGISGMGGLGKTTMANKIRNRALEEHVFDEVVMAVVSQQVDESKIQQQIAEQLGVNLVEQTLMARANRLRERLNDSKRTLLILDDVWESLKLVELGIPCGSEGCRILFTSRNRDALSRMDVGKVFGMQILSEEEAWLLFRGKAGTCADHMRLNSIAEEVVEECRGLPIALVTVGTAMKDEMDERIWKDAVKQLRKANPKNIPEFIKEVYNPLEVSYTKLASEEARSLCLLCCLFPEDANIEIEQLTYFCMGLHILEDVMSMEDARDRTWALIKLLKSRSLLLDGNSAFYDVVRMHDVVRDVCTFIAKQKGYNIGGNECNWISSFEIPMGMGFPNLRLLVNIFYPYGEEEIKVNINTFFEGIRDLSVLSIRDYPWTSLPPTPTQSLKNLGTLILVFCRKLETISIVGDLVNLELLICKHCYTIKELPVEIGRLNRLKLLDISGCEDLQSIGYGIISRLVGLEELKMHGSFKKWEAEDIKERKNAGLRELESLTNLTCLEIEIEDAALAAQNMRFSSKLKRFKITVGRHGIRFLRECENKSLKLYWEERTCLGHWIQMQLLRDTQCLSLTGGGVNNLELEKIPYNIFTNLSVINIGCCPHLHNLGQLSIAGNDCLPHLGFLTIKNCEVMEQVFLWNQENKDDHITKILFPKLKEIWLDCLPNLTTFCQGIEGIEFPLLEDMYIDRCPKMTSMFSTCCVNRTGSNEDHSSHLFCQQQKVSFVSLNTLTMSAVGTKNPFRCHKIPMSFFNGLEYLQISTYDSSVSLFTTSIAGSLVSIKQLRIWSCSEIEQVIIEEEGEEKTMSGGERRTLVFPNLHSIELCYLPKLVTFCESKCDVEFPSLTRMHIGKCPNMRNVTLGRLIASNWEACTTDLGHLFDVSSWNMKELRIKEPKYPLGHYKIPESFFTRLDKLSIFSYDGSMSLFSSTIARNLVNLRDLYILTSDEIIQVIKDDDEEEKVVSGGEKTPLFPKLERLELNNLSKLVTFCEWNCDIELPSLKNVRIYNCPNMRNLTLGLLTTPNLENITIDYEEVGATKDLNRMLQQHFIRTKEAKEEVEQKNENEEEQSNFITSKREKVNKRRKKKMKMKKRRRNRVIT